MALNHLFQLSYSSLEDIQKVMIIASTAWLRALVIQTLCVNWTFLEKRVGRFLVLENLAKQGKGGSNTLNNVFVASISFFFAVLLEVLFWFNLLAFVWALDWKLSLCKIKLHVCNLVEFKKKNYILLLLLNNKRYWRIPCSWQSSRNLPKLQVQVQCVLKVEVKGECGSR